MTECQLSANPVDIMRPLAEKAIPAEWRGPNWDDYWARLRSYCDEEVTEADA